MDKKHAFATNEANDGTRPPRSAVVSFSFISAGTGLEAIALGVSCVGWRNLVFASVSSEAQLDKNLGL